MRFAATSSVVDNPLGPTLALWGAGIEQIGATSRAHSAFARKIEDVATSGASSSLSRFAPPRRCHDDFS